MLVEKKCPKCKEKKPASAYQKRNINRSGLASWCRRCTQRHNTARGPARRKAGKERVIKVKGGKCQMCNGVFPYYCYDLHHRNPEEKEFNMTSLNDKAWHRIEKELKKCDLLCANCHRITHHGKQIIAGRVE